MSDNERELFSGAADELIFNTFRKRTVKVTITDKRVIIHRLISNDEYLFDDIVKIERFKAMFMNIGIQFCLNNGKNISLAIRHIKKVEEALLEIGKSIS